MVSEISGPLSDEVEKSVRRSFPRKRNHGKLPKKVHKAEREKMKRDHLNELFLKLDDALERNNRQNNGKASILDDATRLLRDLLSQVKCLRRENASLLSESHDMAVEKNELRDEKTVLESQIEKLQRQLQEKARANLGWGAACAQLQHTNLSTQISEDQTSSVVEPALQSTPMVGPVLVIPIHPDVQACKDLEVEQPPSNIPSNVSRPKPRYPTPSDSWPSQLLVKTVETTDQRLD